MRSPGLSPDADEPRAPFMSQPDVLPAGRSTVSRSGRHWLRGLLFERRIHRTEATYKELLWTVANGVTVARLLAATALMLVGIVDRSQVLLITGLMTSWTLDIADGLLARRQGRETVIGAQLDILADRVTAMWVVLGVIVFGHAAPLTVTAAAAVWLQLCFFDQLLAGQFLRFGHWSPDEFHLEDAEVWRLNWAPAAKVVGNLPLALLLVGGPCLWVALVLAVLLIFVRVFSYLRILRRIERMGSVLVEGELPLNVHQLRERDELEALSGF